jgi:DNA-binding FadR family transcriptional regulator
VASMRDPAHTTRAVLLRPVRTGNAFEETVERLLQLVKLGVVGPGQRLPAERELAVRLGVGRETLREAIASLRDAGYLEARRGRTGGTFVLEPTRRRPPSGHRAVAERRPHSDVEDVVALRFVLECGAVELAAARRLSVAERRELTEAAAATAQAGPSRYRTADSRLHLTIAQAAGVPALIALVADTRARASDLLDEIPLIPRNIAHSDEQHAAVVDAILRHDAESARAAMREHLEGSASLLRAFLG